MTKPFRVNQNVPLNSTTESATNLPFNSTPAAASSETLPTRSNKYGTSLRSIYLLNKTQPQRSDLSIPLKPLQPISLASSHQKKKLQIAPPIIQPSRPKCMDWTRWLVAGSVSHVCVLICGTLLVLHQCMCAGLSVCLLVLIPMLGWSSDGTLGVFGYVLSTPNVSTWGDHATALTMAGIYMLLGVFTNVIGVIASLKLAHRCTIGYLIMGLASVAQIGRLVFLLVMIRKNKDNFDDKSGNVARILFVAEFIVLAGIICMFLSARWRHNEHRALLHTKTQPTLSNEYDVATNENLAENNQKNPLENC